MSEFKQPQRKDAYDYAIQSFTVASEKLKKLIEDLKSDLKQA